MICTHTSIKQAITGQEDDCILCKLPIIFNGTKWIWRFSLSARERAALTQKLNVDRIIGQKPS